jgi:beta-lactamase regulating signal transducer with metallopeptidase domain
MTTSQLLSSTPGWLLDVSLQTTALLVSAGLVIACRPRLSAARKHFVQASALLLIPVVIFSSFFAPSWRIEWRATPAQSAAGIQTKTELNQQTVPPRVASTISMTVAQANVPHSPIWALVWLAGICVGGLALGCSALSLRRLRTSSRPVPDSAIRRCFQEEAAAFQLHLPDTSLRMSGKCQVPMTWGLARKVVLLSEQACDWPETRLRLVLRHELAHIARGDILVSLLTTLAALLLWFHPLVWLMLRASQRSREQASDDLALAHSGQNAGHFAEELLAAVASLGAQTGRRWLPLALAMSVSAGAKAMQQRLANLVYSGRGRLGYSRLQKLALVLPMAAVAFGLAGLTACRKAEPARDAMILVRSRFISIPVGSPVLAEAGLVVDDTAALQNLGILSADQATALLQKLSQQKGIDLMSAPSVTTKSGQKATVEVVREFIYPTKYEPAKQLGTDQPVIPTTPTAFEMRPVGVRMELNPTLLADGSIDLTLTPEVTSFEGFMDYGKSIEKPGDADTVLTENKIQQPIFHSLKTTTTVKMQPGQSIVFGGLGSPESTPLTDRLPKTKDLVFFIVEATTVDESGFTLTKKTTETAVTVFGQVKRQGKYTLKPSMTVKDLLDLAGGLSERADASKVELKRGEKLFIIPLPESAKALQAGDVLTVPAK